MGYYILVNIYNAIEMKVREESEGTVPHGNSPILIQIASNRHQVTENLYTSSHSCISQGLLFPFSNLDNLVLIPLYVD